MLTGRSLFRVLRWAALAADAPVLWACNARTLEKPVLKPESTYSKTFQQSVNRNVDLLFMVDDSSSMRASQNNLLMNFPTFMTTLQSGMAGLPNIHVAVVSSDMGAGDGSIAGCNASGGNQGVFQYTNRAPAGTDCTANALNANQTYISNIAGQANYTGNLAQVFTCIAALGEAGCGFEHQFASVLRALGADGSPPPQENQGFLRPEAYLVVIFITNEDDCSAAPGNGPNGRVPLFDTSANRDMASQLGPPQNFRCNEFGHTCPTGVLGPNRTAPHPDRTAPNNDVNATVNYDGCGSDDTEGYLLPVATPQQTGVADLLKKLKTDQSQVLVAAITGAPTPYQVHWKNPSTADMSCGAASCPWPEITHSCTATDGSFADPGVRVAALVQAFGANGLLLSICDQSFAGSLMRIGQLINAALVPPCVQGKVATKPGSTDPDCAVISHTSNGSGGFIDGTIPWCNSNNNTPPCWSLMTGGCANGGYLVNVSQDPNASSSTSQNATVNCTLCTPMVDDPIRGCCWDGNAPTGTPACCNPNPNTMQTACAG